MEVIYHGCAAFEFTDDDGNTILVDPWISDNPHAKKSVKEFTDVETIFVTHGASDHLGDAPQIAKQNDAPMLCDFATSMMLYGDDEPLNDLLHPYVWGMEAEGDNWTARVLEARHPSQFIPEKLIGTAQAYMIEFGGETIYHLGDTSIFRDIELFGQIHDPTICCVPVGEATPKFSAELFPDEAALVAEWLAPGAERIFPMHYPPGSDKPRRFVDLCEESGVTDTVKVSEVEPGTSIQI